MYGAPRYVAHPNTSLEVAPTNDQVPKTSSFPEDGGIGPVLRNNVDRDMFLAAGCGVLLLL
jgi:hypothetical protein